ncbi:uncharacterized protein HKW66_Vig0077520 [Vigna angularis]|uniref:Uncharacterized protein n=1 Tax=Phaseolus angularis TaxID=3914 RepID=A0A8T0K8J2_PHAAN|nr:uncharacterized protein HKW66_Vig0077520 [Vigna angularis]
MKSGIWGFWNLVLTIGVFLEYLDLQIGFLESSVQVARFGVRVLIWESLVLPCSRKWVEILFFYAVWGSIGVLVILGILGFGLDWRCPFLGGDEKSRWFDDVTSDPGWAVEPN